MTFSKLISFFETGLCKTKETFVAITKEKDALTADAKTKFLLQSHLSKLCDKLM
jgi:hypothetical protein